MRFKLPFSEGNRRGAPPRGNGTKPGGKPDGKAMRYLLAVIVNTVILTAIYYAANRNGFWPIFPIYAGTLTVMTLVYLIYNRGFSRKGVTAEMLPADWTDEQKNSFIKDGEDRLKKTKWMLLLMIPLILTFLMDCLYLLITDLG